jgi:antitoxin CcdA
MANPSQSAASTRARRTPREAVNLTVDPELLAEARSFGLALSALFERALADELALRRRERWVQENAAAIDEYNERIASDGVFSDGLRRF